MPDGEGVRPRDIITFGPFRLFPAERLLEQNGTPVHLGGRALDILLVLLEHSGQVVASNDLIAQVWRNVIVEDGSLRVHIAALRKALGDGKLGARYIKNIPGRGYCFVAVAARTGAPTAPTAPEPTAGAPRLSNDLPGRFISTVGRDEVVAAITAHLPDHRLVTIVGAGGIGKTTVALAVARALIPSFDGAVCFVDLGPLADPLLVSMTLASKLGLPVQSDNPIAGLINFLRGKRILVILDSCERVIETTAVLTERILKEAGRVHVLATSREALRVEGEHVHRLLPLETPPVRTDLTADEAVAFPAIRLFVERAEAALDSFAIGDATAATIADICRRLDGIPLAIELAAARVDFCGVQGIAAGLNDLFSLLTKGRRTALSRHQTLRATLDWSYQILSPMHQTILRRLAVFRGRFGMASVIAIVACPSIAPAEVVDGVTKLVATSLLTADVSGDLARYRLLDTTRAYAMEKLAESDEGARMVRRHAMHCLDVLENAETDWELKTQSAWLEIYGNRIDDIRAALDWAFSPAGDVAVGIGLTTVSAPVWFALSLGDEFRERAEHALKHLAAASLSGSELEMKLCVWLGSAIFNSRGPISRVREVSARALEIAEQRDLPVYQLWALWKLSGERYVNGDYPASVVLAERYAEVAVASGRAEALLVRDRMMSLGLHLVGRQAEARLYAERAINHPGAAVRNVHASFHQYDTWVSSRSHLARILWVQGFTDRAAAIAGEGVAHAMAQGYPPTIYYILVFAACPIAFWTGKTANIARYLQVLQTQSTDFSFSYWQSWRRCYEQTEALGAYDGTPEFGQRRDAVLELAAGPLFVDLLGTIRPELAGQEAVRRAEARQSGWCAAEILRAHGVNLLRQNGAQAPERAESLFREALDLARQQGAFSWELRVATSLARLWRQAGRKDEARTLLAPVHDRVTEGFDSADVLAARQLLSENS